jgi:hypothetical protein
MRFIYVYPDTSCNAPVSRLQPNHAQLSRLASMHLQLTSNKHAKLVLRANGLSSSDATVAALRARIDEIADLRQFRALSGAFRRTPGLKDWFFAPSDERPPLAVISRNLKERLRGLRVAAVTAAAKSCIRHGAAGGSSFSVTLTSEPSEVGYRVDVHSNWDTYRGRFKGWRANEDHHYITVPTDWRIRVLKRGLANVDGFLTLTAQQMAAPQGLELFRATWAERGRGYAVNVRRGFIARHGEFAFHAETVKGALSGVLRKAKFAKLALNDDLHLAVTDSVQTFVRRLQGYAELTVSLADAYATGACEFGVRSWCLDVGIDAEAGQVTLGRVLDGYRECPLEEVRRTVLHVVRRARRRQALREVQAELAA